MGLLHASLLNTLPDVQIVALCEKKPLIRKFSRKVLKGINVLDDVGELSNLALDAVYVTTPPSTHFSIIKAVYSKRIAKNIFVEKPLASNRAEAEELCNLARNEGINMVGYNRRFAVTFRKAKEVFDEGVLGEPVYFEGYAYSSDLLGVKPGLKTLPGGSVLRDLGCHAIDLALWFFGKLQVEKAGIESMISDSSNDSASLEVKTSTGLKGNLKSSRCMENYRLPEVGLITNGSKGMMRVNDDKIELRMNSGKSSLWHRHDLGDNVGFFLGRSDYFREDKAFVEAITNGLNIEPSFRTARDVDKIISQVEEKVGANEL